MKGDLSFLSSCGILRFTRPNEGLYCVISTAAFQDSVTFAPWTFGKVSGSVFCDILTGPTERKPPSFKTLSEPEELEAITVTLFSSL